MAELQSRERLAQDAGGAASKRPADSLGIVVLKVAAWILAFYLLRPVVGHLLAGQRASTPIFDTLIAALLASCVLTAAGLFRRPAKRGVALRLAAIVLMLGLTLPLAFLSSIVLWAHG